ncbi:MAG: hypothetical protein WC516_05530 [Patescibacteria group bacterium]
MAINYVNDILTNISDEGMTNDLWKVVYNDVDTLSKIKINNDRERNLYFYIEHFIDDLCDEFKCSYADKNEIVISAFERLRNKENVDLTDIRKSIFDVINKKKKVAYPNTRGTQDENSIPQYDVNKWIITLSEIYAAIYSGKNREAAIEKALDGWSPMEKFNFENWVRYYEHSDHEKYGIQKSAAGTIIPSFSRPPSQPMDIQEDLVKKGPGRPKKIKSPEQDKIDLINRLNSAIKILDGFHKVWPPEVWRRLSVMLFDLKNEILPLRTTATMIDCIVRTANKLDNAGFSEGAQVLIKIAQPPTGDIASKIERALSGRGPEETGGDLGPMPPTGDLPPMGEILPPAPGGEMMPPGPPAAPTGADMTMAPPAGVEGDLPAPETPPAPPIENTEPKTSNNDNPFEGKSLSVQDVLGVLEPLAKKLGEREFVRALSKADMMLDSMNIASHFPELGEAQAKALELNIYVGTRLEKIINKLKGGLKGEKKEEKKEEAPEIEMGEFAGGPPKEKEMFEVSEEAPVPPAPAVPVKPGV